jgi:hypothetical protein
MLLARQPLLGAPQDERRKAVAAIGDGAGE